MISDRIWLKGLKWDFVRIWRGYRKYFKEEVRYEIFFLGI